jgi:iron(III) transport system permease protein
VAVTSGRPGRLTAGLPGLAAPPARLLVPALVVAGLAAVPLVYLLLRALAVDTDALALVVRPRTVEILAGTVLLGAAVGAGAIALGLPLAWLTARTDLPGRRVWAVLRSGRAAR